ncbi:MAG: insulinase family protein [Sedimentisphaerales bacterium]|nr:insulinase family protein [Sedimentisphaerales bacterium]
MPGKNRTRWIVLPIFLSLYLITGCEHLAKPSSKSLTISKDRLFDYQKIELDNGLQIITMEDFSTPIVAIQVWYQVGSKDEQPDRQGYAHMFEHMMFKGTDHVGDEEHSKLINKVGGSLNAGTYFDWTFYYETVPVDQLELALWLEAERMNYLRIDQEAFDTERKVVEEELRMGENRPYGTLYKRVMAGMYQTHPYRWTPIGNLAHLRATSVADLRSFWTRYYVPNNAVLVITGAVTHQHAQQMAKKYFGWVPPLPDPPRVTVREPKWESEERIVIKDENAPAAMVDIAWRTVPTGHDDEIPLSLLSEILGGGASSRLYRDLVADKQWAVSASASTWNLQQDGLFFTDAVLAETADANAIVEVIWDHINRLQNEGVTSEELTKARNQMLKSVVTQNLSIDSKARLLGSTTVETGNTDNVNMLIDRIRSITRDDLQAMARKYLRKDSVKIFIVEQNKGGMTASTKDNEAAVITAEPETNPPAPGRAGIVRPENFPIDPPMGKLVSEAPMPKFSRHTLGNGLKVLVVPNHEVPFVTVMLGFLNGAWTEDKPGTANLAMQMLKRGTEKHTEAQLAQILDENAISLSGSASMDTATVNANCLTDSLELTMELLTEIIQIPTFNADEFEKLRTQELTGLSIELENPSYLAGKHYRELLYGNHPYARTVTGEIDQVKALTTEDLQQWWASSLRPEKAALIFAGDISKSRALELARVYLDSWEAPNPPKSISLPAPPKQEERTIYIVDVPGAAQCQIRVGQRSITRHEQPEYFISRVVTNYFGGTFESRLMQTIRVKKGLTYGARGAYIANHFDGEFTISTFTKNEAVAETVRTIFEEIDRLRSEPPSDEELNNTKSYFLGSFVRNRETPQSVADDLWLIESQNLQKDYLECLLKTITETSKEDCVEFVKETLAPDRMVVVVTGDAEKVQADLETIAPVKVIEPKKTEPVAAGY